MTAPVSTTKPGEPTTTEEITETSTSTTTDTTSTITSADERENQDFSITDIGDFFRNMGLWLKENLGL